MNGASEELADLACRFQLSPETAQRLDAYRKLLEKWNPRINLTASTEWRALSPLFEEAVWAAGLCPVRPTCHLDIGSGAGFPALPIALLHPESRFDLLEPRERRAAFLETVALELGLRNVVVFPQRLNGYLARREDRVSGRVSWKAIRLAAKDANLLLRRAAPGTEFWLFHGRELPVEDTGLWDRSARLECSRVFPRRPGWFLSIYVSRETEGTPTPSPCFT
jgi:16S rRNA (guanine527-N7)-methyltransferase